jgi:cysteine desulfurase
MKDSVVYLDYHATTPLDSRVFDAMVPYLQTHFGNPSSKFHSFGWKAQDAVDRSRTSIASALGANPDEIIFTSGSTESNNLALRGITESDRSRKKHIITCVTEHKSILNVCSYLEKRGWEITYLPVSTEGLLDLDELEEAIRGDTLLISLMAVNNEIGVIHPLQKIGELARRHNVLFHTDATQAIGKFAIDVNETGIDLLSLSGHKVYGPKGVGALYVRTRDPQNPLHPLFLGGGQERNRRAGTLNVAGIVGLARAIELSEELRPTEMPYLVSLRNELWNRLQGEIEDIKLNGSMEYRVQNNLNVSFRGIESPALLMTLDDIALSLGSSCTGGTIEPSHVLRALYMTDDELNSAVRFGLGRFTTREDIDYTADRLVRAVASLRQMN